MVDLLGSALFHLGISASEAAQKASNTAGVPLLGLPVALVGGATITEESAENTPRAGYATDSTRVTLLLSVTATGLGTAVSEETTKNTLRAALLDLGVPARQAAQKASDTTGVAAGAVAGAAAAGAAVAEKTAEDALGSASLKRGRVDGGEDGQGRGHDHGVLHFDRVKRMRLDMRVVLDEEV
ncbi:uncharacterized protein PG986_010431 [Apiospora aurea]|uniref:Uncharacterized protein n=1 Tax=Apiospora aurea TaxID=335848 RepID=A0ABR1Q270_9PEZI